MSIAGALRRVAALAGALMLPLVGLAELGAYVYFAAWAPSLERWSALTAPVAARRRPGDLVVVAPRWAEPMARQALGDDVMPIADVARPDLRRHRTALEISLLGERAPELAGWQQLGATRHGPWTLRRIANPTYVPLAADFLERVDPERLQVTIGAEDARCRFRTDAPVRAGGLGGHPTFPRRRFVCPGSSFFNVGVTVIADQDFRARRCIWAHPPRRGALRLRFRDVPLGDVIAGHGGMYWIVERERSGAPVELAIDVDGERLGQVVHRDGQGWAPFEIDLGTHAGQVAREVLFSVTSADHRHRHFCFEAHSR